MCEDNDKGYSYHTYGQSDVYRIDPRYREPMKNIKPSLVMMKCTNAV